MCFFNHSILLSLCRERNHKIVMDIMAGIIQNTIEREALDDSLDVYFNDSLQSFVNAFSLPKGKVGAMEENLMKTLTVSCRYLLFIYIAILCI